MKKIFVNEKLVLVELPEEAIVEYEAIKSGKSNAVENTFYTAFLLAFVMAGIQLVLGNQRSPIFETIAILLFLAAVVLASFIQKVKNSQMDTKLGDFYARNGLLGYGHPRLVKEGSIVVE